jgi:hypothetical protein
MMISAETVVSTLVGVLAGWGATHYYFMKSSAAERIAEQIKVGLQKALIPILYPHFYNPERAVTVYPEQPPPQNMDVPFVEYAIYGEKVIRSGQAVEVLIKLRDVGSDLDNPHGVTVRDHRGNRLAVVPLGLGFARVTFHTVADERPGPRRLTVDLQDMGDHTRGVPNRNVQSLLFVISQGDKA